MITLAKTMHYLLGASKAERWTTCTASVKASEGIESTVSSYAEEGTVAHSVGERCLRDPKLNATDLVGEKIIAPSGAEFEVTDEMAEAVQVYVDYVRARHAELKGSELWVEKEFKLTDVHPDCGGPTDATSYQAMGKLIVIDYKHGAGKAVNVEDNDQLKFYGLGALAGAWDVEDVELVIVQPRAFHKGGHIRSWSIAPDTLVAWGQKVLKAKAAEAMGPAPKFIAGSHCKYCPYSAQCPTLRGRVADTAMTMFNPINAESKNPVLVAPAKLTSEQLGRVYDFADEVEDWLKAVRALGFAQAMSGNPPLGRKLVAGKAGNRKWKDEKAVEALAIPDDVKYEPRSVRSGVTTSSSQRC